MEIIRFEQITQKGDRISCSIVFDASSLSGTMTTAVEMSRETAAALVHGMAKIVWPEPVEPVGGS